MKIENFLFITQKRQNVLRAYQRSKYCSHCCQVSGFPTEHDGFEVGSMGKIGLYSGQCVIYFGVIINGFKFLYILTE